MKNESFNWKTVSKKKLLTIPLSIFTFNAMALPSLNKQCPHKIVVATMQKTGSNMLTQAITLITGKEKQHQAIKNWSTHFYWTHPKNGSFNNYLNSQYKVFTIYRDPREHLMSIIRRKDASHIYTPPKDATTIQQRLTELMTNFDAGFRAISKDHILGGTIRSETIDGIWRPYLKKKNNPHVCMIKFENLVGPQGGGSKENQHKEIRKIAKHLNINLSESEVDFVAQRVYGGTFTFNTAQNNSWKKYFTQEHKRLFKQSGGKTVVSLGYEPDDSW